VWSGIRRTHGRPPRKKRGLKTEDLKRLLKKLRPGLTGIRDKALLLTGFAGALRREELAALSLNDVGEIRLEFVPADGMLIHVGRAKGDQEGRGSVLAVPYGRSAATCPVSAVRAWLEAAGIAGGPVFREVDRHGRIGDVAIGGKAVARIVKTCCARAGLPPADFAGHSLRRGMITSAHRGGTALPELKQHSRHKRVETVLGYIEDADRFASSAAGRAGL
jgi:integrase